MADEIIDLNDEEPQRVFRGVPEYEHYARGSSGLTRFSFSKRELTELAISIAVMSLAFSFIIADDMLFLLKGDIAPLLISFIAVGSAFFFHEIGHKFMAQKYELWAEFRMWKEGLMLALFLAVASGGSFVFAAPGAVHISGANISRRVDGITSLVGPVVNILIGVIFLLGLIILMVIGTGGFLWNLCVYGLIINLWLAAFNMIPFPPLDGHAVMRWNPLIWGIIGIPLFIVFIFLFLF